MTITIDDIKDLKVGDIVRFEHQAWTKDTYIEGPCHRFRTQDGQQLYIGGFLIRNEDGEVAYGASFSTLELVKKVVRFYVNADREPVTGDVAITKNVVAVPTVGPWFLTQRGWIGRHGQVITGTMPESDNILLVDGTTGQSTNWPDGVADTTAGPDW